MQERESELGREAKRQEKNEELRKMFAQHTNVFHTWLTDSRTGLMDGRGTLEEQLEAVKAMIAEILQKKDALKKVEDLGAQVEEALIFDNKSETHTHYCWFVTLLLSPPSCRYTEHTTVSLAQQWDQLSQSAMRMQHNLEQQIQARNTIGVSEEQLKEFTASFRYISSLYTSSYSYQLSCHCYYIDTLTRTAMGNLSTRNSSHVFARWVMTWLCWRAGRLTLSLRQCWTK